MPLIKSASKKAFSENVSREMHAGKSQPQSLAIAFHIKRQAKGKKKMAQGGEASADQRTSEELEMLRGREDGHEAEIRAASMRPSADEMEKRGLQMKDAHPMEHEAELDARDEGHESIDDAYDKRSQQMREPHQRFARGGELDARDESLASDSIDAARDEREMDMLDAHPLRHADELDAKKGHHYAADDSDERELDMLHQHGEPDEYSKEGIINYAMGGIADKIRMKKKMAMGYAEGGDVDLQENNGDEHLNQEDQMSYDAARKKTYYDNSQLSAQPEDSNEHADVLQDEDAHGRNMIDAIRAKMKRQKMMK